MDFSAQNLHNYRQTTEKHARTARMKSNNRACCKCGEWKPTLGGKQTRGTSRLNPSTFTCSYCLNK